MFQNSRKFFNNINRQAHSFWIFNVNKLGIGLHRKQPYFTSWKILYGKVLYFFKRTRKNMIDFEKKKNDTVNKRRIKIAPRYKIKLYLWKKNLKKAL